MSFRHLRTIGGKGTGPGQFASALRGIDVDAQDRLYAAGDSDIKVYDPRGTVLRTWRTAMPARCVAVAGDGRVFAGETGQIEVFDASGRLSETWRRTRLGSVTAIGFTGRDVVLADAAARVIHRLDGNGTFLNDVGANNRMKGFQIPNGTLDLSVDDKGVIHAANPGRHRVEQHSPDDRLLGMFGRFDGIDPAGFSGCCNPTNVAVRGDRVYVTEKAPPRVKVYSSGRLLEVIASDEFDPNGKNLDVAVDGQGQVYVTDPVRLTILVFAEGTTS